MNGKSNSYSLYTFEVEDVLGVIEVTAVSIFNNVYFDAECASLELDLCHVTIHLKLVTPT